MLTVPAPSLAYDALAPGVAPLELPLTVGLTDVTDGPTVLDPAGLATFGLVTYRQLAAGALREVYVPTAKTWLPDAGPDPATGQPLAFRVGNPQPWQGIVVAAGPTDGSGAPVFAHGAGGYPAYSFAGVFATKAGERALGGTSASVSFGSVADRNLMVIGPADGEKPERATEARLLLKSPALAVIGGLVVHRDSPGAEVTLSNAAGASIVLRPDGSVEVRPAPGRGVLVAGDLEAERITYLPGGGGPKQVLP